MKRSTLLDAILFSCLAVAATALLAFVQRAPPACPPPDSSSVASLFAPCLVQSRFELKDSGAFARLDLPPLPRSGERFPVTPAGRDRDVDATGSIPSNGGVSH